jgi:hypothetical protein
MLRRIVSATVVALLLGAAGRRHDTLVAQSAGPQPYRGARLCRMGEPRGSEQGDRFRLTVIVEFAECPAISAPGWTDPVGCDPVYGVTVA